MRINVPFGLHAYSDKTLPANAQLLINFLAEAQPRDSKNEIIVSNTPGSLLSLTTGVGPIHGLKVFNDVMYVVSGEELYGVSGGAAVLIGTIVGNKRVSMEHNGVELCIVNGHKGYVYDTTNGLREITDLDFFATNRVVYLERRFLFPRVGTRQFFCSDAFDGFSYDGLNFDQLLTDPDKVVSMLADHGELWIFGKTGTEIWVYNRNEAAFPYSRVDGSFVEKGCAAAQSPAKNDSTFFWLGHDLAVYRADGYNPLRISTHAIEQKIQSYDNISEAFGSTFTIQGHYFYELTFPGNATWRYDASTGLWHQAQLGNTGRYHANSHAFFENKNFIGDYRNGNIYEISLDFYTDNGDTIYRTASTPHIHSGRNRAVMDRIEIDIDAGKGLIGGQGSDPQIMLKYSDDGGRTWSSERWANMGRIGEYSRRVRYTNLGMFYQRTFQITISDPIKGAIIDAFCDVEMDDSY